jgi:hypothetical protein
MTGGQMGPNQRSFYDTYESATLIRNKMDHLAEAAQNLAGRKGMRPPIFGAISYFLVEPHQMTQTSTGPTITSGTIITVTAGSEPSAHTLAALPNPIARPVHPPTSQFMLTAFDWTLDFEEAVTAVGFHLNKTSDLVNESVKSQCKTESARSGVAMDVLMAEPPFSTMTLKFDVLSSAILKLQHPRKSHNRLKQIDLCPMPTKPCVPKRNVPPQRPRANVSGHSKSGRLGYWRPYP